MIHRTNWKRNPFSVQVIIYHVSLFRLWNISKQYFCVCSTWVLYFFLMNLSMPRFWAYMRFKNTYKVYIYDDYWLWMLLILLVILTSASAVATNVVAGASPATCIIHEVESSTGSCSWGDVAAPHQFRCSIRSNRPLPSSTSNGYTPSTSTDTSSIVATTFRSTSIRCKVRVCFLALMSYLLLSVRFHTLTLCVVHTSGG